MYMNTSIHTYMHTYIHVASHLALGSQQVKGTETRPGVGQSSLSDTSHLEPSIPPGGPLQGASYTTPGYQVSLQGWKADSGPDLS